jgi:hypothetical protein
MEAKEYIDKVRRYLFIRIGKTFITPLDFSLIWDWWECGIPLRLIWESILPERLTGKRYPCWHIDYNVQRHYKAYLQLSVGSHEPEIVEISH